MTDRNLEHIRKDLLERFHSEYERAEAWAELDASVKSSENFWSDLWDGYSEVARATVLKGLDNVVENIVLSWNPESKEPRNLENGFFSVGADVADETERGSSSSEFGVVGYFSLDSAKVSLVSYLDVEEFAGTIMDRDDRIVEFVPRIHLPGSEIYTHGSYKPWCLEMCPELKEAFSKFYSTYFSYRNGGGLVSGFPLKNPSTFLVLPINGGITIPINGKCPPMDSFKTMSDGDVLRDFLHIPYKGSLVDWNDPGIVKRCVRKQMASGFVREHSL